MQEKKSAVLRLPSPQNGKVTVMAKPRVTEREVVQERAIIIQGLHDAYMRLNGAMAEFQQRYDANPALSIAEGVVEGARDGGATWLSDQAEMLDKAYWQNLGKQVGDFTGECIDRMAVYSREQYENLEREVNRLIENPEKTLGNWAWWQKNIESLTGVVPLQTEARNVARALVEGALKAQKLYKHRDAIMRLPTLLAKGDPKPIQAFVENELMDIDPELARAIRGDKRFAIVLEVLADHESTMSFVTYMGLMIEAIPPNFLAYIAGKGAMYLIIELVLLIVTAFISAGAAAAARIAQLLVRITAIGRKVSGATRKFVRAKAAALAFVQAVEDLNLAAKRIHDLGPKLMSARSRGVVVSGKTEKTLVTKKKPVTRDARCQLCHSTKHSTPRSKRGTVTYK
jgi:hypothetical protein